MKTNIIVVTGGVYSSLGKGIIASSIGCILKHGKYKIAMLKLDPYLNTDPGLLSPIQHGEVFITEDGQKTDLDLGHYERFTGLNLTKASTQTGGKLYSELLSDEKKGKFGGATIQVIPHLTDKIMQKIDYAIKSYNQPDFLIIEIGGTIGDIEGLSFIEALRLYNAKNKNVLFIHCSPLFRLSANDEIKTKPTQHSIKNLRNLGINPHILVLRFSDLIGNNDKEKLSWSCDVNKDDIFVSKDCKFLYEVPSILYQQGIQNSILNYFKLKPNKFDMSEWDSFLDSIYKQKTKKAKVAICGEYIELNDSYLSLIETLKITSYKLDVDLTIELLNTNSLNLKNYKDKLNDFDGFIVPDGEYSEKNKNAQLVVKYCHENNKTFLGIKSGMRAMADYFASLSKIKSNNTIDKIEDPNLFLGAKEINVEQNTLLYSIHKKSKIKERHWNNWVLNKKYVSQIKDISVSSYGVDENIESIEFNSKKCFFLSVLYHPEYISKPGKPHPLFEKFVKSII